MLSELVSRVRVIWRRVESINSVVTSSSNNGVWQHQPEKMQISYHGQLLINLTRYEYRMLAVLLKHPE